ncbi:hypothetical protein HK101_009291 [Irineochytrium annulatum]|nr:hypothetical protein HK101_009291 [Irineochytrium annulatum]
MKYFSGWIGPDMLKAYLPFKEAFSKKTKKPAFLRAIQEADNPELLLKPVEAPTKKRPPPPFEKDGNTTQEFRNKKKKRDGAQAAADASKNSDVEDEVRKWFLSSFEQRASPLRSEECDHKDKRGDRLFKLRKKLQKFLQKCQEDTSAPDLPAFIEKADKHLAEVENYEGLKVEDVKSTKIGKVIRKISTLSIPNDEFQIVQRSASLMEKWKSVFIIDVGEKDDA